MILLDVVMPGLDGYEVCQGLKGNPATANIAVIFVTAVQDEAVQQLAIEAGAAAYITKPFPLDTLPAVTEAALAKAERQVKPKAKHDEDGH